MALVDDCIKRRFSSKQHADFFLHLFSISQSRLGLSHIIERVKERRANLPAVLEARGIAGVGLGITS